MLKHLIFLLLFLAFIGCAEAPSVAWEQQSLTEELLTECQDAICPDMTINYVLIKGDDAVSNNINNSVQNSMVAVLTYTEDSPKENIEQAMQEYAKRNQDFLKEFPDSAGGDQYECQIEVTTHGQLGSIVSLEQWSYLYEGGAHGNSSSDFLNFDLKTGQSLELNQLIADWDAFLAIAENAFREQRKLSADGSLNEEGGFWFDEDRFRLPNSAGISVEGMLFIYNPYDIASYADGSIEFTLSIDQIEQFINPEFL